MTRPILGSRDPGFFLCGHRVLPECLVLVLGKHGIMESGAISRNFQLSGSAETASARRQMEIWLEQVGITFSRKCLVFMPGKRGIVRE